MASSNVEQEPPGAGPEAGVAGPQPGPPVAEAGVAGPQPGPPVAEERVAGPQPGPPVAEERVAGPQPGPPVPEAGVARPAPHAAEHGAAIAQWAVAAAEHRAGTAPAATTAEPAAPPKRQRDAVQTRAEILAVAAKEFADQGYDGARVDQIAAQMRTTKRMIYYYFGSKEDLFVAVLEQAYATIRNAEQQIDVEQLDPVSAIRRLAELTFDHHESHQDFIRLVSIENIHRAEHLRRSPTIAGLNTRVIDLIAKIVERGRGSGVFVRDVDAVDLHMMISAFCVFRVANRHTFGVIFDRDLTSAALRDHYRAMLGDMVVGYLTGA